MKNEKEKRKRERKKEKERKNKGKEKKPNLGDFVPTSRDGVETSVGAVSRRWPTEEVDLCRGHVATLASRKN